MGAESTSANCLFPDRASDKVPVRRATSTIRSFLWSDARATSSIDAPRAPRSGAMVVPYRHRRYRESATDGLVLSATMGKE